MPQWGHLCEQAGHLLLPLCPRLPGPTLRGEDPSQLRRQVSRAHRPLEEGRVPLPAFPLRLLWRSVLPLTPRPAAHSAFPLAFPLSPEVASSHTTYSHPCFPDLPSSLLCPLSHPAPVGTRQPAKTALRVPLPLSPWLHRRQLPGEGPGARVCRGRRGRESSSQRAWALTGAAGKLRRGERRLGESRNWSTRSVWSWLKGFLDPSNSSGMHGIQGNQGG